MSSLQTKVRITRGLTVFCYVSLLVLFTAWYLIIHPVNTANPWVIWLIHFLPLACFLPSIRSGNPRSHAWLCFILLLYFNEAVLAAATNPETRLFGLLYSALVVVLFIAAMMYARWASQYARQATSV